MKTLTPTTRPLVFGCGRLLMSHSVYWEKSQCTLMTLGYHDAHLEIMAKPNLLALFRLLLFRLVGGLKPGRRIRQGVLWMN